MTVVDLSEKREQSRQLAARAELRSSLYAALDGLSEEALLDVIYNATAVLDADPMYDWMTELKLKWVPYLAQLHDGADLTEFLCEFIHCQIAPKEIIDPEHPDLNLFRLIYSLQGDHLHWGDEEARVRQLAIELLCAEHREGTMTKAREIAKLVEAA